MTAVIYVLDYLIGYAIFGLFYWFLNGILVEIRPVSETGSLLQWANYCWWGSLVVYMIFGTFWFLSSLKKYDFERRL